ncbi:MAG TPA: DUF2917 domain-containing protein [Rectinemataceae bacterium]|nr:DUF2917 domain-containing protein [Rectinemataceae bacterium]
MNAKAIRYMQVAQINTAGADSAHDTVKQGHYTVIDAAKGKTLTCSSGLLWVTQENDIVDHILSDRQSFTIGTNSKVILSALRPSSFTLA